MQILIVACIFAILVYLGKKQVEWTLYLLLLTLPLYVIRFDLQLGDATLPTTLLEIQILALTLSWWLRGSGPDREASKDALQRFLSPLLTAPYRVGVWLFLLAATIAVFVSTDLVAAVGLYRAYFIEPLLVFCIFADLARGRQEQKKSLLALGGSVLWLSLFCLAQYIFRFGLEYSSSVPGDYRVMGVYNTANAVGLYLAPLFLLFLVILIDSIRQSPGDRLLPLWFGGVVAGLGGVAVFLSYSRGAWIGIAIASLGFLIRRFRWKGLLCGVVIGLLLVATVPEIRGRFEMFSRDTKNPADIVGDPSANVHWHHWQGTWDLLMARPVQGAGLVGFQDLYPQYKKFPELETVLHPHMIVLNLWVQLGFLGLVSFGLLIVGFFVSSIRARTNSSNPILLSASVWSMACLLVHGMVDVPYFKNDLSVLFWLVVGIQLVTSGARRASTEE